MPLITESQLNKYLPHRPPFVMVSELLEHTETTAKASLKITEDNVLIENDTFPEAGLLEFTAQTLALHSGYAVKDDESLSNAVGVIGAVKNYEVFQLPNLGETIYAEISIQSTFLNMTLAEAKIYNSTNILLATAELKTARSE